MKRFVMCIIFTTLVLSVARPVDALPIINTFGLVSPAQTLTFDEVIPIINPVTNQYSAFGVIFATGQLASGSPFPNIFGNYLGRTLGNPFVIQFLQTQTAAAFALITNLGTSTFTALLNGTVVETFSAATNLSRTDNFFGFSGIQFDEIRVFVGGPNGAMRFDNLQFTPVPEPSTIILLALGMLGLGAFSYRRKRSV